MQKSNCYPEAEDILEWPPGSPHVSDPDAIAFVLEQRGLIDLQRTEQLVRELLIAMGENPDREGLVKTPHRVAKTFRELMSGYLIDPVALINDAIFHIDTNLPIVVTDIEFSSLCEHHLLPFLGRVHVAYIPAGKVIGLSNIPRIVEMFSRRLQIQEVMTAQIADFVERATGAEGVAVIVEASHMCAVVRGVRKPGLWMRTREMRGVYRTDTRQREEILHELIAKK